MKIDRYYAQVFVELEAYDTVRLFKRGEGLTVRNFGKEQRVFRGEQHIGNIRGKKRSVVGAVFGFVDVVDAEFFNMNEKEGVMLIRVKINDEPYK